MKKIKPGLFLLVSLMMTGCGGGNSSQIPVPENKPVTSSTTRTDEESASEETSSVEEEYFIKEPTTISVWSTTGKENKVFLDRFIEEFEKKEPNVTVDNHIISGGYADIKTNTIQGFGADNYGDLVVCYPDHVADYIKAGKAVDLTDYMNNPDYGFTEEDKADYYDAYIKEGQQYSIEGTYSLPYCSSTEAMYYNYSALQGVTLPGINDGNAITTSYLNNLTWEELFDKLCPAIEAYDANENNTTKLLNHTGDNISIVGYDSDDNLFITLCEQYGIPYTRIDETTGKGVFDFYENVEGRNKMAEILVKLNGYAKKGYLTTQGVVGKFTNTLFTKQNSLFSIGSTAGVNHQFSPDNPMRVEVTNIPHAQSGELKTIKQGPSLCILTHGTLGKEDTQDVKNRKLASWLLYKTITSSKNATTWSLNTGYTPIRKSVLNDKKYKEYIDIDNISDDKTQEALQTKNVNYASSDKTQNSLFTSPAFVGSSTARTEVGAVITQALKAETLDTNGAIELLKKAYENAKKAQ